MKERKVDYSQLEKLAKEIGIVWMDVPYALEDFEEAMEHELETHSDFTDKQVAMIARDHLNKFGATYCKIMESLEQSIAREMY